MLTNKNGEKIPTEEKVRHMSIKELQTLLRKYGREDVLAHAIEKSDLVEAKSVMSSPPVVFKSTPTIRDVVNVLSSKEDHHNGFPVVDSDNGKFIGLILRSHLLLLLKNKKFMDPRRPHR